MLLGLIVGSLFTGNWFWFTAGGEPLLFPGESRDRLILGEVAEGIFIFLGTGLPVAVLIALRPSMSREVRDDV